MALLHRPHLDLAQNNSTESFVGFVQDPNSRGTVGLVTSCLLTLILCVWSALHLNVPPANASAASKIWTISKWIAVGIYSPELVVFAAWRQWSSAKILSDQVNQLMQRRNNPASTKPGPQHPEDDGASGFEWTLTHSFFASTGGFALEPKSLDSLGKDCRPHYFPKECPPRLTLTARGVALLAECGIVPDVPAQDIWDKSKASVLAKAVVILQALWMLVQVIARLIEHLPVTLLEVNTVAHVLCALTMYTMWWQKPLLVDSPIVLRGDWVDPLCAYMLMCSEQSGDTDSDHIQSETMVKRLFVAMNVYSKTPEIHAACLRVRINDPYQEVWSISGEAAESTEICEDLMHGPIAMQPSSACPLAESDEQELQTAFFERRPRLGLRLPTTEDEQYRQECRFDLAAEAMYRFPPLRHRHRIAFDHLHTEPSHSGFLRHSHCFHPKPVEYLAASISNWPYDDLLRNVDGLTVGVVLWACNLVYGAIHAAAWNDHFPSTPEQWIWRGCCAYITFCGGLWTILNTVAAKFPKVNEFWNQWMHGKGSWVWSSLIAFLVALCGSTFAAARIYLVLEAFISIRSLPLAAYDTPQWSNLIPHF